MTTATATALDTYLPHFDASTVQRAVVNAAPEATYEAIWSADLLSTPLARILNAAAMVPERVRAWARREPPPALNARSARMRDMLTERSPWVLLADEPGNEVVLGLLWTPPAGGIKRPAQQFADCQSSGLAKVIWSLSVHPFGAGHTVLVSETRTQTTDDIATRRFALIWPVISPFAALLRSQVLRAIKEQAEQDLP